MAMDFLRRSARNSKLGKIRNTVISKEMNFMKSLVEYVRYKH